MKLEGSLANQFARALERRCGGDDANIAYEYDMLTRFDVTNNGSRIRELLITYLITN